VRPTVDGTYRTEDEGWVDAHERRRWFRELVAESSTGMLRVAARILGHVGDAEDAVQDAFSRVWEVVESGALVEPEHARTYLYRAVTNSALDALRRRKHRGFWTRLLGDDTPEPPDAGASPDVLAALGELGALLEALPDEQRVALVLKDVEGWTSAEIAQARGCSEGAVEQRLLRARGTLREKLERGGGGR
jgi:RNA polymerase sigma-70 factor (ECF subfamily)